MRFKEKRLPGRPSTIIRMALKDLEKTEHSKDYVVNMSEWVGPPRDGKCPVCFAGSIMAHRTYKELFKNQSTLSILHTRDLELVGGINNYAYLALNSLRCYLTESALDYFLHHAKRRNKRIYNLLMKHNLKELSLDITRDSLGRRKRFLYSENPERFKNNMESFAKTLADRGL